MWKIINRSYQLQDRHLKSGKQECKTKRWENKVDGENEKIEDSLKNMTVSYEK